MEKRHFVRLAKVVAALRNSAEPTFTEEQLEAITDQLALVCQEFGPKFNYDRFWQATQEMVA